MKKLKYDNPVGIQVELTGKCNLKCYHCYNSSGEAGKFDLDDSQWISFVNEIVEQYTLPNINITGGEPLLRRELLFKILKIFSEKSSVTTIRIMTNGYLLNEEFLESISSIRNNIEFQISLDGANKDEHQEVRRVPKSWEKAIDSCLLLVNSGYKVQLASCVTTHNCRNIESLFKLAVLLGVDSIGIGCALPLGRGIEDKRHIILKDKQRQEIFPALLSFKKKYDRFIHVNLTSSMKEVYRQYSDVEQDWLIIDFMGNVKLDTRLPYIVGNIMEGTIRENWKLVQEKYLESEVVNNIIESLDNGSIISNRERIRV